jgi:hypothetical protein
MFICLFGCFETPFSVAVPSSLVLVRSCELALKTQTALGLKLKVLVVQAMLFYTAAACVFVR